MTVVHLGHNWYGFPLSTDLTDWVLSCLSEYIDFVQPYDSMLIRAKKTMTGRKEFKIVFSARYNNKYNFPVCYLLDVNAGKFKGNKMHYCIDSTGTHYSDVYPTYSDRFKFGANSQYNREKRVLYSFLNNLEIPDHIPTSHEKRQIRQRQRRQQQRQRRQPSAQTYAQALNNPRMPPNVRRKKKKSILLRDLRVSP